MSQYKINEVHINRTCSVSAWYIGDAYLVQTCRPSLAEKIRSWSFSKISAVCCNGQFWVFKIPLNKWKWVCRQLGLPLPEKSSGRVAHGKSRVPFLKRGTVSPSQYVNISSQATIYEETKGKAASHVK
jgi:hypothetical protein